MAVKGPLVRDILNMAAFHLPTKVSERQQVTILYQHLYQAVTHRSPLPILIAFPYFFSKKIGFPIFFSLHFTRFCREIT